MDIASDVSAILRCRCFSRGVCQTRADQHQSARNQWMSGSFRIQAIALIKLSAWRCFFVSCFIACSFVSHFSNFSCLGVDSRECHPLSFQTPAQLLAMPSCSKLTCSKLIRL